MTVAACAAAALFAALPAAPALAVTTLEVMVIGSSSVRLSSATVDASASPPTASVTFDEGATTGPLVDELIQAGRNGTRLAAGVQIYVSGSGQGTDTTLSSALVTRVVVSIAGSTGPSIVTVSFEGETASVCTGAGDSCAPSALPSLQLVSSANPSTAGVNVTFTATEPELDGAGPPGGTVSFTADSSALPGCTDLTLTAGQASCTATSLSTGDHAISAQYSGDTSYTASAASLTQTVNAPTPPVLSLPPSQTAEATGAGGAVVTYTATATDAQDGPLTPTCSPASGALFPLGDTQVNCSVTDSSGLTASGSFTVTVQDTTPPSLNLPSGITAQATGPAGAAVGYTATATDLVDGPVPVSCTPASGSTFPVGTTTVSCSATDAHGNSVTGSFEVTVSYAWSGFFQPVDNPPTVNTAKAGSAIPVKFSLTGNQGLNVFQAGYPASAPYACSSTAPTDAIDQTVTAGASSLSYDPATDQYTYVWKTDKAWAGTCRALVVKLADGTTHTADFQFNH